MPPESASTSRAGGCGPISVSSSTALSSMAESLPPGVMIGNSFLISSPTRAESEHGLPRIHPVDVPAQSVDLAVVADVAVRMRQLPARKRVGGEALVHQTQRAHNFRVRQFLVEVRDLRRQQQAFVDDRARRKRGEVEETLFLQVGLGHPCIRLVQHVSIGIRGDREAVWNRHPLGREVSVHFTQRGVLAADAGQVIECPFR